MTKHKVSDSLKPASKLAFWCGEEYPSIRSDLLVHPALEDMLGEVDEKIILDIGCGNGNFTEKIANKGADILGIYNSRDVIDFNRGKMNRNAEYLWTNICTLPFFLGSFSRGNFNIAYASMSFQELNERQIIAAYKNAYEALKKEGILIVAAINPKRYFVNSNPKLVTEEAKNPDSNKFSCMLHNLKGESIAYSYYCHNEAVYLKHAKEAGFDVVDMAEPMPTKAQLRKYKDFLTSETKVPAYILMKFLKK